MAAKDIVEEMITKSKIAVFSKSYCPYCRQAKATLKELVDASDIKIIELDETDGGSEIQEYLKQKTGQRTVPNVFINQKHIGGNDSVQEAKATGELQKLIAAAYPASKL